MRNLLIAAVFQLGWLACVTSGARARPLAALTAAAATVACILCLRRARLAAEARLLVGATLLGAAVETFHLQAGVFTLNGESQIPGLCPLWLAALWTMFAALLRGPLAWLAGRYVLSAFLGATLAAPNYIAGAKLEAVTLHPDARFCVAALMLSWALAMPALLWLAAAPERAQRRAAGP